MGVRMYLVLAGMDRVELKHLPPRCAAAPTQVSRCTPIPAELHAWVTSCREELLDVPSTKKEWREKLLHMHHVPSLQDGDHVWLTVSAQKLHVHHKYGAPVDDGPFKVVKKLRYETYKVILGNGICATLGSTIWFRILTKLETSFFWMMRNRT